MIACALRLQLRPLAPVLDRWPLLRSTPGLAQLQWARSDHLATIEPLSVAAVAHAILSTPNESVVLDIGANVGAYTLLAGALGRRVVAVEMQPGCLEWQRCHSVQLDQIRGRVRLLNRFVATNEHVAPVRVPKTGCAVMASPSAVVGRWPHGLRTKETRKLDKATPAYVRNATRMVRPIQLADYVRRHFPHARSIVAKVDTEGYEIQVLESMRALWPQLRALVVELQPAAWKFANVSAVRGLETLTALMAEQSMLALTLPHAKSGIEARARIVFDPCAYKMHHVAKGDLVPPTVGLDTARVLNAEGLMGFVEHMLRFPGKSSGWFHEVLLIRKAELCTYRSTHKHTPVKDALGAWRGMSHTLRCAQRALALR